MEIELKRMNKAYHYQAETPGGHAVQIDANPAIGGEDKGPRPMELMLMGMAGCVSIDLGIILKKQKVELDDYSVKISGVRDEDSAKAFNAIQIDFHLIGEVSEKKAERAAELAVTKYCSALKSLKESIKVTYDIHLREK